MTGLDVGLPMHAPRPEGSGNVSRRAVVLSLAGLAAGSGSCRIRGLRRQAGEDRMIRSGGGRGAWGIGGTVALGALLACAAPVFAQEGWRVDRAWVAFEVRNAGLPVRGTFEGPRIRVCFDSFRPEAGSLSGAVDPATIRTGISLRDRHLQRRDWFHVERYGAVEMRSVRLWKEAGGFAGDFVLRIRDVERHVTIPFAFEVDGGRARIRGATTIDRLEFGLGKPSVVLADDVRVELELVLVPVTNPGAMAKACP